MPEYPQMQVAGIYIIEHVIWLLLRTDILRNVHGLRHVGVSSLHSSRAERKIFSAGKYFCKVAREWRAQGGAKCTLEKQNLTPTCSDVSTPSGDGYSVGSLKPLSPEKEAAFPLRLLPLCLLGGSGLPEPSARLCTTRPNSKCGPDREKTLTFPRPWVCGMHLPTH